MRTVFSILTIAMFSVAVHAQQVQRIEISDPGIYKADITDTKEAPGAIAGRTNLLSNIKIDQSTTTIPAKLGISFGFKYNAVGTSNGTSVKLKMVTHYPSPGLREPKTGNIMMRDESYTERKLGASGYRFYTLEESWELVPGTWTFEVWEGDRKLATQSFTVIKP